MKLLKFTSLNFQPPQKLNVCECVRKVTGPPCGVPSIRWLTIPSCIIPLLNIRWIRLSTRSSPIRVLSDHINRS